MAYEIEFLPVGESNGDAICLRYTDPIGQQYIHVVDAGYVDTGQVVVDHINAHYGAPTFVDHVVLTHADRDHAGGIQTVLENFDVGMLWMNRPWLYAEEIVEQFHGAYTVQGLWQAIKNEYPLLVDIEDTAMRRGIPISEVFAGDRIGQFLCLAPARQTYLSLIPQFEQTPNQVGAGQGGLQGITGAMASEARYWKENWFDEQLSDNPPATTAANESSVVQMAKLDGHSIVLTGDAGPQALEEAAAVASHFGVLETPNFFQIPHHGSRRNVTPSVLNRWLGGPVLQGSDFRGIAFCSTGTNKPDYPRRRVRNAFLRRGYGVYSVRHGWITHRSGYRPRAGEVSMESEIFETEYNE